VPDPEVPAKARSRKYSASYKARILVEYEEPVCAQQAPDRIDQAPPEAPGSADS
jgi:hypothetical protein